MSPFLAGVVTGSVVTLFVVLNLLAFGGPYLPGLSERLRYPLRVVRPLEPLDDSYRRLASQIKGRIP